MKLGFSTVACMDSSYKEVAECAALAGIHNIEIRLDKNNKIFGLSEKELPEFMEYFKRKKLIISDLGTSVVLLDYEPEKVKKAKECIKLAAIVGTKGIRIFLAKFLKRFSDEDFFCYEGIVKALQELCEYARKYNIEIWIETHNAFSKGSVLKRLLDDVAYENLKIIWDIIHPLEQGELPEETVGYVGKYIAHVHIKDGVKREDKDLISYEYTKLGQGELPIAECVRLLTEIGYAGCFSLEWEREWRAEIRNIYDNTADVLQDFCIYMKNIGV